MWISDHRLPDMARKILRSPVKRLNAICPTVRQHTHGGILILKEEVDNFLRSLLVAHNRVTYMGLAAPGHSTDDVFREAVTETRLGRTTYIDDELEIMTPRRPFKFPIATTLVHILTNHYSPSLFMTISRL
nr:hypothetical protein GCM10020241_57520 [Streptoalloteichus tenebrarius]